MADTGLLARRNRREKKVALAMGNGFIVPLNQDSYQDCSVNGRVQFDDHALSFNGRTTGYC